MFEDVKRMREIASVIGRHGLREVARLWGFDSPEDLTQDPSDVLSPHETAERKARRWRLVLEELGSTSIKLGQILSTRPDLLPPEYINAFARLQDHAPAVPFEQVRHQVESSLGKSLEELFAFVDPEPLATASMAQVHRARMDNGREVIIKVQRPGIDREIRSDMAVLYTLARLAEATIDDVSVYNPVALVKAFEAAITQELNFLIESQNTKIARKNCEHLPRVIVPQVIDSHTSSLVITQTYIEGYSLSQLEEGSARAKDLCDVALKAAFEQVFRDGFFHADPHPGNILVTQDNAVVFLDWGLIGRLSAIQRDYLIDLLFALVTQDIDSITRMIMRMGEPQGRVSLRSLKLDVEGLLGRTLLHRETLQDIDVGTMMEEVMAMSHKHGIRINPEYALLAKASATVEGVLRGVYPELDVVQTLKPYGQDLMAQRLSGERVGRALMASAVSANSLLRELPLQIDQLLMDVEGGQWQVQVSHPQLDQFSQSMGTLGIRIFLGMMAGSLVVGGCVLLASVQWHVRGVPMWLVFAAMCFLAAGGFAFAAISWGLTSGKVRIGPWLRLWRRR